MVFRLKALSGGKASEIDAEGNSLDDCAAFYAVKRIGEALIISP